MRLIIEHYQNEIKNICHVFHLIIKRITGNLTAKFPHLYFHKIIYLYFYVFLLFFYFSLEVHNSWDLNRCYHFGEGRTFEQQQIRGGSILLNTSTLPIRGLAAGVTRRLYGWSLWRAWSVGSGLALIIYFMSPWCNGAVSCKSSAG